ncbi:MAG: GAF domain-containing protein [Bacteroidales bacterium]|nr:GAF domain-containing protein [Bacteroidales bacterium]
MHPSTKKSRYDRIFDQLSGLLKDCPDRVSSMSTIVALLHHKMDYFFWTGFYLLRDGALLAGPYQGPLACIRLKKDTGVCWAGINRKETIIVPDVHQFSGHIACDPRSQSEIVVPLKDDGGTIIGVLDVDSREKNSFDETDREGLERILNLIR